MHVSKKLGCAALALVTLTALAQSRHYWDASHQKWNKWDKPFCKLQLIEVYQPMGGGQPVHLKIKNLSSVRVGYDVSISVNNTSAGSIHVDNANQGEVSDRDSNQGFKGTLPGSTITLRVSDCKEKG